MLKVALKADLWGNIAQLKLQWMDKTFQSTVRYSVGKKNLKLSFAVLFLGSVTAHSSGCDQYVSRRFELSHIEYSRRADYTDFGAAAAWNRSMFERNEQSGM